MANQPRQYTESYKKKNLNKKSTRRLTLCANRYSKTLINLIQFFFFVKGISKKNLVFLSFQEQMQIRNERTIFYTRRIFISIGIYKLEPLVERGKPKAARLLLGSCLAREVGILGMEEQLVPLLYIRYMRKASAARIHAVFHRIFHERHHDERLDFPFRIFKLYIELQIEIFLEAQLFQVRIPEQHIGILFQRNKLVIPLVKHHAQKLGQLFHRLFRTLRVNLNQRRNVVQRIEKEMGTQLVLQKVEFILQVHLLLFAPNKRLENLSNHHVVNNADDAYKAHENHERYDRTNAKMSLDKGKAIRSKKVNDTFTGVTLYQEECDFTQKEGDTDGEEVPDKVHRVMLLEYT